MTHSAIPALRRTLAALEQQGAPGAPELFSLGLETVDASLGGGLARGGLHEFYAREAVADAGVVAGFGLGVALRAARGRPLLWVQKGHADTETGGLYGSGLSAFGLDPGRLILLRARDPTAVLRAAEEGARCAALGAVIVELRGTPAVLDLKANRRLALQVRHSGVPLVMIRLGAEPAPSAAFSRWLVLPRVSTALEANAPGHPAFDVRLLRHRAGVTGRWLLEWDRDRLSFTEPSPLSRSVVSVPRRQPVGAGAEDEPSWRRAG